MKNCSEKTMNSDKDRSLEVFVSAFFESCDAETEVNDETIQVLLPEDMALRLNTPEFFEIKTETGAGGDYTVNYGSALLEKMVSATCAEVPIVVCRLVFNYLKSQGFEKLIKDRFSMLGAVGRVENTAEIKTEYIILKCRYLAQSDEQKEGLKTLAFNLETGAFVTEMDMMLHSIEKTFETELQKNLMEDHRVGRIMESVQRHSHAVLAREIEPFKQSMNRRFRRDVDNLKEYYEALQKEMEESLKRPGLSDQLINDRKEKIGMIPEELKKKRNDLYKKYSIKVKIDPAAIMLLRTPAVKILYKASVGRKQRRFTIIYNPATKTLDPIVCQGCGDSTFNLRFCSQLHLLCPACGSACPICGKQ